MLFFGKDRVLSEAPRLQRLVKIAQEKCSEKKSFCCIADFCWCEQEIHLLLREKLIMQDKNWKRDELDMCCNYVARLLAQVAAEYVCQKQAVLENLSGADYFADLNFLLAIFGSKENSVTKVESSEIENWSKTCYKKAFVATPRKPEAIFMCIYFDKIMASVCSLLD